MVTGPKDVDSRLESNKPKEFVKDDHDYSSIRMQLDWTHHIIPKHFLINHLKGKEYPILYIHMGVVILN
jgi:hypothetical protein